MLRLVACESDKDGAEHGEHPGLDKTDKHLEGGHEHAHDDTYRTHSKEDPDSLGGYKEDDAHQ